jgi:ribulose-phosphate 3-epimerase
MLKIIPSILTSDPQEFKDMVNMVEEKTDRVQIDVIDGKFVDNKTVDPSILNVIETNLKIDFHLMTKEPIKWVEKCIRAQADRIIGHIEMMTDQGEFIKKVQSVGCEVGLGVDIDTPIEQIKPVLFFDVDVILLMSYKAGFGGQEFNKEVIKKIEQIDSIRVRDDTPFEINVDGGINKDTIRGVVKAGADEVSVGKGLFNGRIEDNINELIRSAHYES